MRKSLSGDGWRIACLVALASLLLVAPGCKKTPAATGSAAAGSTAAKAQGASTGSAAATPAAGKKPHLVYYALPG